MRRVKHLLKKIFILPLWLTLLIAVPSFAFVFIMLGVGSEKSVLAYASYLLSAYAVVITATGLPRIAKAIRQGAESSPIMGKLRGTSVGKRYFDDPFFRSEVSLYIGLGINLLFACINLFPGIRLRSPWYISLAVYYVLLSAVRFILLQHVRRIPAGQDIASEFRSYRLCGWMLLTLNLALCAIVTMVAAGNMGFEYVGNLIYAMAAYAFYSLIVSIVSILKFRRLNSPVMSAAKLLNLTVSMVAMLSLETAMISRFGSAEDIAFRLTMTAASGFFVCAIVLGMAVFMIIRGTVRLKKFQKGRS